MRKVIYTCIVGGYDPLLQPEVVDADFDYVCFTDASGKAAGPEGVWKLLPIPKAAYGECGHDKTALSRYVKLQPHKALSEYDCSVWIDANISITGQGFYDAVNACIGRGEKIAQVPHLTCDCVYEDIRSCYRHLRINFSQAHRMAGNLRRSGYPHHWGLMENNLIMRLHNDRDVMALSDDWWHEFLSGPHRDQFSLMPLYWKSGVSPVLLFGQGRNTRNVQFLEYHPHPGLKAKDSVKGVRRLPLKAKWTFRRFMSIFL